MKKIIDRNKEKPVQKYRAISQIVFILICIWIGIEFYHFVSILESGSVTTDYYRPPGVEAFLPISAMMSVYYFMQTGMVHGAHPAGFFILVAVILVSFIFGKSFCSWICPVGTISEYIADFGEMLQKKLFKRVLKLPKWLDYFLRSLKYLLLAFFVYSIFFTMTISALRMFLDSQYNVMADVKMWYFFADISKTAIIVLLVLFGLSIFIRNFWCRYLCPYGALLGIFSILSPNKIKRNTDSCIDCQLCAKACPSRIKVDKVKTVISDECSTCLSCVDACPVADTLQLKSIVTKEPVPPKMATLGIVIVFLVVIVSAMISGHWQNNIRQGEYINNMKTIHSLGHPRSINELEKLNEQSINTTKEPLTNREKNEKNN